MVSWEEFDAMLISEVLSCFLITGLQLFVSLRLLGHPSARWKIPVFTFLQAFSTVIFHHILANSTILFLSSSATYVIYFMWIFNVDLFPDTLAVFLLPFALKALGELLFLRLFPINQHFLDVWPVSIPRNSIAAYLPIISLVCYLLLRRLWAKKKHINYATLDLDSSTCLTICGLIAMVCYFTSPNLNIDTLSESLFINTFLGACFVTAPFTFFAAQRYITSEKRIGESLEYHVKQHAIQKFAVKTLREERHEFINELTLISTYLQMGKIDEAIVCIDYSSAKLADRNNYATLPHDAWLTVLQSKEQEAKEKKIDFKTNVEANAPYHFLEQRLLPKLIINLVDNAFQAVANQSNPEVTLSWSCNVKGERLLTVTNNGPQISPLNSKRIFQGGVTTKKDSSGNHGWGLLICRDIARELGGSLTFESKPEQTAFTLTLPPIGVESHKPPLAT